tara:strand:- start:150 stop:473 length:324 start_codon:yes stop_codon:yes gene_type:complete
MSETTNSDLSYHQIYYINNRDKTREYYRQYGRLYYAQNKEKWRNYYQNNKERIIEYQMAYNSQNEKKIQEYQKKYWIGRKKHYKCQKKPKKEPKAIFEKRITIFHWD